MAQPVTVYRWDDVGAPQIVNRTPSEVIDILTKCLVDGYGSKDPLGWTRPFYDGTNHVAAFRNSVAAGGSGGFFKFWDASGTNASGGLMRGQPAASMIDIDTLIKPGYLRSASIAASQLEWVLIGTPIAFFMFVERAGISIAGNTSSRLGMFFGDIMSNIPNDSGRFVALMDLNGGDNLSAASWPSSLNALNFNPPSTTVAMMKIWDADAGESSRDYSLRGSFHTMSSGDTTGVSGQPILPQVIAPYRIEMTNRAPSGPGLDRLGTPQLWSNLSPIYRGVIPGLFHLYIPGYAGANWPLIFNIGSDEYYMLPCPVQGAPTVCIKLGAWNDPFVSV